MIEFIQHDLQNAWDLAGSQVKAKALEIALEKALFDKLLEPKPSDDIAHLMHLSVGRIQPWLDLLWSMGYLSKTDSGDYVASALAQRYLVQRAEHSCAQAVLFRLQTLQRFCGQFDALLEATEPVASTPIDMGPAWAQAAKAQIFEEQRAVTVPALRRLFDTVSALDIPNSQALHCLDLGAGAGLISIALMQRFPQATGVAFDFPETAQVAQANIHHAGLEERLAVQSGNLNHTFPMGQFDLIWCSSVLHFLDDRERVLQQIATSLNPNGLLLLLHAEHSPNASQSAQVLPFYVPMMMKGNYLPSAGEVPEWLKSVGLELIHSEDVTDFPMAPVRLHCFRKVTS